MTVLSPMQVAHYAHKAGFQGSALVWATAVALAESGGRTDATYVNSDRYHSVDRGLWQINSHWHPEVSDAQAFDPTSAAQAAYRISHGGKSWTPWATFNNGHAKAQYGRASLAVSQLAAARQRAKAAGGGTGQPPTGSAAPSPKAPGVGSTGGGSTPGNTSSSTATTTSTTPSTPGAGGAGGVQNASLGGALVGGLGLGGLGLDILGQGNPLKGVDAVANGIKAEATLFAGLVSALTDPHTYVRAAYIGGGVAAVLLGAYLLANSGAAGATIQGAARSAGNTVKGATKAAATAAAA